MVPISKANTHTHKVEYGGGSTAYQIHRGRRGNSGASWDPIAKKDFELAEGSGPILILAQYLNVRNKIFKELNKLCSAKNIMNNQA